MSTTRLRQARIRECALRFTAVSVVLLACALAAPAVHAATSHCSKPVDIHADYQSGLGKPNGVVHLRGDVVITQCSLKITAAKATIHLDADLHAKRAVLAGAPAHVRQIDDQGNLIKLHADGIDYVIATGVATLTGDAFASRAGQNTISAASIVYNTHTNKMASSGNGQQRVHMTFKPHQSTAPSAATSQPAPASSNGGH